MHDTTAPSRKPPEALPAHAAGERWLLLIHQIPPKPDYLRVKVGRRLARVGAVAIKNSVYVLPRRPESYEDFQWIVREIQEAGGDAFISDASLVEGLSDAEVRGSFDAARDEEYAAIRSDAAELRKTVRGHRRLTPESRAPLEHELAKLRRRFEAAAAIDFFGAPRRDVTRTALDALQQKLADGHGARPRLDARGRSPYTGRTWVTRRDVHVDRIASAWLVRRSIDPAARFRFVDPDKHTHATDELRFDMFQAEFTHEGDACTFETLLARFALNDPALRAIAEIVHDVDCKDAKFGRDEASGLRCLITGIAAAHASDDARLERGFMLFDDLYAAFHGAAAPRPAKGKSPS